MTEADQVSEPQPDLRNEEQDTLLEDLVPDVPPEPMTMSGTPLVRRHESDAYGLQQDTGEVVESDLVGMAELSSEYTTDHAIQDTDADTQDAREAWGEARDDWDEVRRESADPRGPR